MRWLFFSTREVRVPPSLTRPGYTDEHVRREAWQRFESRSGPHSGPYRLRSRERMAGCTLEGCVIWIPCIYCFRKYPIRSKGKCHQPPQAQPFARGRRRCSQRPVCPDGRRYFSRRRATLRDNRYEHLWVLDGRHLDLSRRRCSFDFSPQSRT